VNWQQSREEAGGKDFVGEDGSAGPALVPDRPPYQREVRLLSIGELGTEVGLSVRTIRYYEELGLLPGVRRRASGRRVYGGEELERLRFIQRLKALGCSLSEIRELDAVHAIGGSTAAMLARLDALLAGRLGELDARIAELAGLRDEIGQYRERIAGRLGRAVAASKEDP
jgi:DNA-binding transcriptional MerR regulator